MTKLAGTTIKAEITYRDGGSEVRCFSDERDLACFVADAKDHPEVIAIWALPS